MKPKNDAADQEAQKARASAQQPQRMRVSWSQLVREALRPNILIPTTLGIAVLATLLGIGNIQKILADLSQFQARSAIWCAVVIALSIAGRGVLWHVLLRAVRAPVPFRSQTLAFLVGIVTTSLPLGNYFPNYILSRSTRASFGLTSAATLAITLLEVTVSLIVVVVLGLGAWTSWLRPVILVGTGMFLSLVWGVYRLRTRIKPLWAAATRRHQSLQHINAEAEQLSEGASRLWHPRVILLGLLICACYLTLAGIGLFIIARGFGLESVSVPEAVAVYDFSLAFALIEPSPVDLGVIELGGVGAFLAIGVSPDLAISIMLIQRVLTTGVGLAVAALGMVALRHELTTVLRTNST